MCSSTQLASAEAFLLSFLECSLPLLSIMAEGLLGASPSAPAAKTGGDTRRVKLYPWDSTASQLLEPYGESAISSLSLADLWKAVNSGNKSAMYHSHLCAPVTDQWHIGAGISLTAAALEAAATNFKTEYMQQLINPQYYEKISTELVELEPIFKVLNLGKGSQVEKDTGSFRAAKRSRRDGPKPAPVTEAEVLDAARKMYKWLAKPSSAFRSFLFITSAGNTFYSGHVAEVVARAAISHKPMREEDFVTAMQARLQKPAAEPDSSAKPSSDATGLF